MERPLVFISHITAEKEVALALKKLVSQSFMGMIDVFVSSDPNSISLGGKWLEKITDALKSCVIEIVLASPQSIRRPWINFEAGAGWIRDVPVIPFCHSGLIPDTLPPPLNSLQGAVATDPEQLRRMFSVLARTLGCDEPTADFDAFIAVVKAFEVTSNQLSIADASDLTSLQDGLSAHEIATLIALAESSDVPGESVWPPLVQRRMNEAGYQPIACSMGVAGLIRKGLVESVRIDTGNFNEDGPALVLHANGWHWLSEHENLIEFRRRAAKAILPTDDGYSTPPDDEIPF